MVDEEMDSMTMKLSGIGSEYRNLRNQMIIDSNFQGSLQMSGEFVESGQLIKTKMSGPMSLTYSESFR